MESNEIHCPKCGSTQITANKKGFSGGKAVAGAILTGGIGLLAGTIGSKKVIITCLNCGKQFKPGEGSKPKIVFTPKSTPKNIEWKTLKETATPKLIWDENLKQHVINPDYKASSGGSFKAEHTPEEKRKGGIVILCLFVPFTIICFYNDWNILGCILLFFTIIGLISTIRNSK